MACSAQLTCNGVESHCNANGVLVHLERKYTHMELKNGTSRQVVKHEDLES